VLGHAAALGHGVEGSVAETVDAQVVAQLPDADEHIIAREVVEIGEDVPGVEEVLGVGKDLDGGVGQPHDVLKALVGSLVKELSIEGGLGAQKVFLNAEGRLFWADQGNDEDRVRLPGCCEL
jgi:hypothetical protein